SDDLLQFSGPAGGCFSRLQPQTGSSIQEEQSQQQKSKHERGDQPAPKKTERFIVDKVFGEEMIDGSHGVDPLQELSGRTRGGAGQLCGDEQQGVNTQAREITDPIRV